MVPEVLRLRDFRRVFWAQLISTVGDFFVPVAIAFAVLDLTGSVSDLGFVLFARILGQVLLFLAGGVWADRLPRQQVMVASHVVRFFSQGLLGLLLVSGHAQVWELIALQLLHGAATGVFRPAASGLTPQLVPSEQLQAANGLMYLTLSVGGIVGPGVGGALVATVGAGWALLGDAATFALAAVLLARIRPLGYTPRPRESFWQELAGGWREVRSRTWLWASIVDFAAFQMIYLATIMVLGPLVVAIVGPIAEAVGVKETLLAAFALTMVSSLTLLLIPDMWRITGGSSADHAGVVADETTGIEIEVAQAREM